MVGALRLGDNRSAWGSVWPAAPGSGCPILASGGRIRPRSIDRPRCPKPGCAGSKGEAGQSPALARSGSAAAQARCRARTPAWGRWSDEPPRIGASRALLPAAYPRPLRGRGVLLSGGQMRKNSDPRCGRPENASAYHLAQGPVPIPPVEAVGADAKAVAGSCAATGFSAGRAGDPCRRMLAALMLAGALFGLLVLGMPPVHGQTDGAPAGMSARAGLVVRMPDGRLTQHCVALGIRQVTGDELLKLAGLEPVFEYGPLGVSICAIAGEGCQYPSEPCWCRCQKVGEDCQYWAYYALGPDGWAYATTGAGERVVGDGDVDGWVWAKGEATPGEELLPPVTFAQLCGPAAGTAAARSAPGQSEAPSGAAGSTPGEGEARAALGQTPAASDKPAEESVPAAPSGSRPAVPVGRAVRAVGIGLAFLLAAGAALLGRRPRKKARRSKAR